MSLVSEYIEEYFDEIDYKEFYRGIFPVGSFEKKGVYENGKYNGIIVEVTKEKKKSGKPRVLRHTLTDELDKLDEVCKRDNFCIMSPISYAGKRRSSENAREIYALAFDIDGIQTRKLEDGSIFPYGLANLFRQIDKLGLLPEPTYIVSSGTGVHLYYVLERPIPYFNNVVDEIEKLKKELTRLFWHDSISKLMSEVQYEPVCQGFRVVGTVTKNGERARAFIYSGKKVTIEYLNSFVREEYKAKDFVYKSDLTLSKAKEKYPEWYQKRIVEKKPRGTWTFSRAVYDKWLERLKNREMSVGHRYWTVWVLAVTAMKCGISQEELEKDAFELIDVMNEVDYNKTDPFTEDDVLAALEGYDKCWYTYPIDKMAYRSDLQIQKNKRNFNKQKDHLELARAIQEVKNKQQNKNWREGNGRPLGSGTAENKVKEWRFLHPDGKKIECHKDTGLSRVTINKWWNNVS